MEISESECHLPLSTFILRLKMGYVGLSSMDICSTQTPSICCFSLGRVRRFSKTPSLRTGRKNRGWGRHVPSVILRFLYRLPSYSGIQQNHGSLCRRSHNSNPALERISKDQVSAKPRKNSDTFQALPCFDDSGPAYEMTLLLMAPFTRLLLL